MSDRDVFFVEAVARACLGETFEAMKVGPMGPMAVRIGPDHAITFESWMLDGRWRRVVPKTRLQEMAEAFSHETLPDDETPQRFPVQVAKFGERVVHKVCERFLDFGYVGQKDVEHVKRDLLGPGKG